MLTEVRAFLLKTNALALAIGVVLGGQLGAHLSRTIKSRIIIRVLSVTLGLVGSRLLLQVVMSMVFH